MQRREQEDKIRHGKRKKKQKERKERNKSRGMNEGATIPGELREERDGQTATEQDG